MSVKPDQASVMLTLAKFTWNDMQTG